MFQVPFFHKIRLKTSILKKNYVLVYFLCDRFFFSPLTDGLSRVKNQGSNLAPKLNIELFTQTHFA